MRLTPNVLMEAPSYLNCEKERTLVLRGAKLPILENLSILKDIHDVLDLTDNDISILGNFPLWPRVTTLLVARNRILSIQDDLHKTLPNLESLSLISNSITSLHSLIPLRNLRNLKNLYLIDNPIAQDRYYRSFIIWLIPQLRILDFAKIKDKEREVSTELFGTKENPTELASNILNHNSKVQYDSVDKQDQQVKNIVKKLTEEDRERLKHELRNATSFNDIDRIENALKSGYI